MTPEHYRSEIAGTRVVLITAHGISDRERGRLERAGKELIDATCPLVRRAHRAALGLAAEGRHVIVIGKAGHVEVEGLVGDLDEGAYSVVARVGDVERYGNGRLGVVCQTTTAGCEAEEVVAEIARRNPGADLRVVDTICQPTKDRQRAMEGLLEQVEMVIVVGGRNSNNTRKLVDRCAERGVAAFHVESAGELRAEWFTGCRCVGLTAGTSTLGSAVREVYAAMEMMGAGVLAA